MNYELLEKVKQHILEEPNRLMMHRTVEVGKSFKDTIDGYADTSEFVDLRPPCGTAACIAGWVILLANPDVTPGDRDIGFNFSAQSEAAHLLGIRSFEIEQLYFTTQWPEDLYERFKTKDLNVRAQVAVEVIDRFIERKKKEEKEETNAIAEGLKS